MKNYKTFKAYLEIIDDLGESKWEFLFADQIKTLQNQPHCVAKNIRTSCYTAHALGQSELGIKLEIYNNYEIEAEFVKRGCPIYGNFYDYFYKKVEGICS